MRDLVFVLITRVNCLLQFDRLFWYCSWGACWVLCWRDRLLHLWLYQRWPPGRWDAVHALTSIERRFLFFFSWGLSVGIEGIDLKRHWGTPLCHCWRARNLVTRALTRRAIVSSICMGLCMRGRSEGQDDVSVAKWVLSDRHGSLVLLQVVYIAWL